MLWKREAWKCFIFLTNYIDKTGFVTWIWDKCFVLAFFSFFLGSDGIRLDIFFALGADKAKQPILNLSNNHFPNFTIFFQVNFVFRSVFQKHQNEVKLFMNKSTSQ